MKKVYFLLLLCLLLLSGCENSNDEAIKNEYITMKNKAFDKNNYKNKTVPVDIVSTMDRISNEAINYTITISNPKENMHNIKVVVVHNYYNEDIFPTIGLFDETKELLAGSDTKNELVLKDTIKTDKDISKIDLELMILIEYIDDEKQTRDIYYKTT